MLLVKDKIVFFQVIHNSTRVDIWNSQMYTKTHARSLRAALFLLPSMLQFASVHRCEGCKQTRQQTNKVMSGHDVWGLAFVLSSLSCFSLYVQRSVWGPSATHSFMERRWGGNLAANCVIKASVCLYTCANTIWAWEAEIFEDMWMVNSLDGSNCSVKLQYLKKMGGILWLFYKCCTDSLLHD